MRDRVRDPVEGSRAESRARQGITDEAACQLERQATALKREVIDAEPAKPPTDEPVQCTPDLNDLRPQLIRRYDVHPSHVTGIDAVIGANRALKALDTC